jgi:hypothetical protein
LLGDAGVTRGSEPPEVLRDDVGCSPGRHTDVAKEIVDVVHEVRADEVSLPPCREHVGEPVEHTLDLGVHAVD